MTKINREKILKAVIGSARLEGYKGALKVATEKRSGTRAKAKSKTTAKRQPSS